MKYASDFRYIAREALKGKWILAAFVTFIASLMGGVASTSSVSFGNSSDIANSAEDFLNKFVENADSPIIGYIILIITFILIVSIVLTLIRLIIGGAAALGYARFSLNLVDEKNATFGDLFSQFNRIGEGFIMNLLLSLYTSLWSLLFIIPGIIKSFSYAMTPYVLYEHPELTPNDAITASREIMDGNKFRLFCLNFSFLGWHLLTMLPCVFSLFLVSAAAIAEKSVAFILISMIPLLISLLVLIVGSWLVDVYRYTAQAAFYREVSGYYFKESTEAPSFPPNFEAFSWENTHKYSPAAKAPTTEAPVEKAPVEEAPVADAPAVDAPAEAPAEEATEAPAEDVPPENEN